MMNGNQAICKMPQSASHSNLSTTDILIQELRACMDALFEEQMQSLSSESEGSDYEGCVNYTWLADRSVTTRRRSSKNLLDNMAQAEIMDMCSKLEDSDIVNILKETQNQAHICTSPTQLLTQVRYLLSDAVAQQTIASLDQSMAGQTPPGRTYSMSKMVAGLKALRSRKNTPTPPSNSEQYHDIEARQTTV